MYKPDKATTERNAKTLRELVKQPDNKLCADCKHNDAQWASWNLGVYLCIRCSGIHRGMGTHISRVKSIDLDMWTNEQMESIQKWGNRRANLYWEARLKAGHIPSDHKMKQFIHSKYESRRWAMEGPPPSDPFVLDGVSANNTAAPTMTTPLLDTPLHPTHAHTQNISAPRPALPSLYSPTAFRQHTAQPRSQSRQLLSAAVAGFTQVSSDPSQQPSSQSRSQLQPQSPRDNLLSPDSHAPLDIRSKYESRRRDLDGPPPPVLGGAATNVDIGPTATTSLSSTSHRPARAPIAGLSAPRPALPSLHFPTTFRQHTAHPHSQSRQLLSAAVARPVQNSSVPTQPPSSSIHPQPPQQRQEQRPNDDLFSLDFHAPPVSKPIAPQPCARDVRQDIHSLLGALASVSMPAQSIQPSTAFGQFASAQSSSAVTANPVLTMWVRAILIRRSANEALSAATKFKVSRFTIYSTICDVLETDERITEAITFFRQIQCELHEVANTHDEQVRWEADFQRRCVERLEKLGDGAKDAKNYDAAMGHYSNALSLGPVNPSVILIKSCQVRASLLDKALTDATKCVERNPSSYVGYKGKHAALHAMGHHREAFRAFETMLSKLEQSPHSHIRKLRPGYIDPTPFIRGTIDEAIRDIPRVLIGMNTGRLYDKSLQAAAFEELPVFNELRSSMTTHDQLDYSRIRREVKEFYRYVMLSHRWQPNEPTFQMVENNSVYGLSSSSSNNKLLRFCELVCSLHFQWAWSDTCCVNQADKGIQQESVVAMFRWYHGSSLTIVHLLGVLSDSQEVGCLWKSIWNTRGWTYQEYIASKVVQFYTEDWKPYLGLDMFNHKESPLIHSEMEQVTNVATQKLATLQPGLDRVREKLYLASRRQTTREEDIAYSLFGIFDVAIPVIYGEGKQAVRRLLEHVLTRSDNVTLISWTGTSGNSNNSYLPMDLTVYDQIVPPHVPQWIEGAEMDAMVMALRSSLSDLSLTAVLYKKLHDLPPLLLVAGRLRLPGIIFPLCDLVSLPEPDSGPPDLAVYRATTALLGDVEIRTAEDLSGREGLLLIHPWISSLLDPDFVCGVPRVDLATRALRLVVRLRQPFGALLLGPLGRAQYRRVATERVIMVRMGEETSLADVMESVRTVDVQ